MLFRQYWLASLFALSPAMAWQTFIVPHSPFRASDDAPLLRAALATGNISSNTTILFQKGITYNIFTPVKFPVFSNVEVAIEGNITYPADITTVQGTFRHAYCTV